MTTTYTRIKIDPDNFLGFQYDDYLDTLAEITLAKPSVSNNMRKIIRNALVKNLTTTVYNTISNILIDCVDIKGDYLWDKIAEAKVEIKDKDGNLISNQLIPNMPDQEVSEIAIGIVDGMKEKLDGVMEKLFPMSIRKMSGQVSNIEGKFDLLKNKDK